MTIPITTNESVPEKINNTPKVVIPRKKPDGWTRIKDRKPQEDYIIAFDGKNIGEAYKNQQGGYSWAIFYSEDDDPCINITHWMSLPQRPTDIKINDIISAKPV